MLNERTQAAINQLISFFAEAKAYSEMGKPEVINTRFEAMKPVFAGKEKLFIAAESQKDIVAAVNFAKKFGITPVITGADEAYLVIDFLKDNNVSVVVMVDSAFSLSKPHAVTVPAIKGRLRCCQYPSMLKTTFKPAFAKIAAFLYGILTSSSLLFGKACGCFTLNAAKAMGVDKTIGSIETGKDATFFISAGDALDMRTNKVEQAFIQGRDINLDNLHKQLDKKFSDKYSAEKK